MPIQREILHDASGSHEATIGRHSVSASNCEVAKCAACIDGDVRIKGIGRDLQAIEGNYTR